MAEFLLASLTIFAVLVGGLYVEHVYRRFAARHPQLGPFRGEGGCGGGCSCNSGGCGVDSRPRSVSVDAIESTAPVRRDG